MPFCLFFLCPFSELFAELAHFTAFGKNTEKFLCRKVSEFFIIFIADAANPLDCIKCLSSFVHKLILSGCEFLNQRIRLLD